MERQPADFVLVDHSKASGARISELCAGELCQSSILEERYVPDLKLLEDCGVIDKFLGQQPFLVKEIFAE